jgi:hypothetical protein
VLSGCAEWMFSLITFRIFGVCNQRPVETMCCRFVTKVMYQCNNNNCLAPFDMAPFDSKLITVAFSV